MEMGKQMFGKQMFAGPGRNYGTQSEHIKIYASVSNSLNPRHPLPPLLNNFKWTTHPAFGLKSRSVSMLSKHPAPLAFSIPISRLSVC